MQTVHILSCKYLVCLSLCLSLAFPTELLALALGPQQRNIADDHNKFATLATPSQEEKKQLSPFQRIILSNQSSGLLSKFLEPKDVAKLNMVDKEDYTQISIKDRVEKEFLPFFKQSKELDRHREWRR